MQEHTGNQFIRSSSSRRRPNFGAMLPCLGSILRRYFASSDFHLMRLRDCAIKAPLRESDGHLESPIPSQCE